MPSAFAPHSGGVEELTAQLGAELRSRGHDVTVLTNRWPTELPERELIEGLPVERLRFTLPGRRPDGLLQHARHAPRVQERMNSLPAPDLVHVQCASSQLAFAYKYCEVRNVPLLISSQGETAMDAGHIYQRSRRLRRTLRNASADAAALTVCSSWTRSHAALLAPAFATAEVVLNGVRPEDWPTSPVPNQPTIAAWGRHVAQKGFDLLIQAFALVREQVPEAQLILGGHGPITASLQAMAGPGVEFVGALDRSGVANLLGRSRIAAVPSRIEPFGIVALEALASGRGLVYSTSGGLGEAAGGLGRGADPTDISALSTALLDELHDPTAPQLGRARAQELSWSRVTDRYEELYRRVAS